MLKKHINLRHHHHFSVILFSVFFLSLFIFLLFYHTQLSNLVTNAYYPAECPVLQIPREKVCSGQWVITRDNRDCRIFTCKH